MNPLAIQTHLESLLRDLITAIRSRGESLLDVDQVIARTTLSRSLIFELERRGEFPARRQITANKVGWLASDVDRWIAARPSAAEARLTRTP